MCCSVLPSSTKSRRVATASGGGPIGVNEARAAAHRENLILRRIRS